VCLVAAGCGSSSSGNGRLLSQSQAGELRASLSKVEQDVAAKNCTSAAQEVSALQDQISTIRRLDGDLRSSLRSSVQRLQTLVSDSCQASTTTTPTTTTPTTPDTGASGASGATGATGPGNGKGKEKKNKEKTPPGQGGKQPPGHQGGGGGAGLPGESNSNGNGD